MSNEYGGNLVKKIENNFQSDFVFCDSPYYYAYKILNAGQTFIINNLQSCRVFLIRGKLKINEDLNLEANQSVQAENVDLVIMGQGEMAHFLIVGALNSFQSEKQIAKYDYAELKKVEKPWGYEIWITGEHPLYCLKKIFIKKATKTSLQYHKIKRETNVLLEGTARLHFKNNLQTDNDLVTADDLAFSDIPSVSVIDVLPYTLHRLEALTDILLFEASTPQLDDVIRVSDDTNRSHGRIKTEHDKI